MEVIEALFGLNYSAIVMGFFIILLGVDKIVFLFGKAKKTLRIKFGFEEDKETIENRVAILEKHDNWQYKEISKISDGIDEIKSQLLSENIESKRKTILDFCSSLSNDQPQNQEAFNYVFKIHEEYEKLLKANNLENGQIDESMKFISHKYQELLEKGNL